jgi:hypothetical protein
MQGNHAELEGKIQIPHISRKQNLIEIPVGLW